jgi:uncharacterized membrane protein YeaQ/YmgE (transglycosylase-associated protein family)
MDQMGFFAWLIIGAIAGWLASKVMGTSRQQGLLLDIPFREIQVWGRP